VFEARSWRGVFDTTLCDKVCLWIAEGWWFSPGHVLAKGKQFLFLIRNAPCYLYNHSLLKRPIPVFIDSMKVYRGWILRSIKTCIKRYKKARIINLRLLEIEYIIQHTVASFWFDFCFEIQPIKIKRLFTLRLTVLCHSSRCYVYFQIQYIYK
jgi:hypothetical protein